MPEAGIMISAAAALKRLQTGERLRMQLGAAGRVWTIGDPPHDISEADALRLLPMLTLLGDALFPDPMLSQSWELRGGQALAGCIDQDVR